jgi:hypothetical protein
MSSINFTELNVQAARNFRNLFSTANVYLFLGKSTEWETENSPTTPRNCDDCKLSAKNNILYLQKLSFDDTCLSIPYKLWQSGQVYVKYTSSTADLYEQDFYVITASNNVYKCIDNNDGALSTQPPTGTSANTVITSDGYQWKFMYNLSQQVFDKFFNTQFIPVPTGSQKTSQQTVVENSASYMSGTPQGGHGKDASSELFAKNVTIFSNVDLTALEDGFEHRQYGLILNPTLTNGTLLTDNSYVVEDIAYDTQSGKILTVSNHIVVEKTDGSAEKFQMTVKF